MGSWILKASVLQPTTKQVKAQRYHWTVDTCYILLPSASQDNWHIATCQWKCNRAANVKMLIFKINRIQHNWAINLLKAILSDLIIRIWWMEVWTLLFTIFTLTLFDIGLRWFLRDFLQSILISKWKFHLIL